MEFLPRVGAVLKREQADRVSLDGTKTVLGSRALHGTVRYSAAATASATAISTNVSEKVGARPRSA